MKDYRVLFEKAPEPLIAVSEGALRITAANDRALVLLGLDAREIARKTLHDILAPACLALVLESLADRETIQECLVRDSSGVDHPVDFAVTRIVGGPILLAIHDACGRALLQEQLRHAQKMEALGMLAGGIAHDFNNLLTIIAGYSQMLQASNRMTTERDRTAIEQVLKASERAAALTAQLLAFSRRQTLQQKVLEINKLVDDTATMLSRLIGEDIKLIIRKAPDAGRIHADSGQIEQLLMNLAINARDAMPHGGSLLIETRNALLESGDIGQQFGVKSGHYVALEVADTGTGMDEETRKRAFEPFFTTKPEGKGTGLGLATVYGIVRQCGGAINLYSEPGYGTTIRVYLPRVVDAAQVADEIAPELRTAVRGGHETILLVEDEEGVRKMVKVALEREGYRVLTAADGPEAIKVANSHEGPIDILVTDMIMPQMNGGELAGRLLNQRPSMGVLFISGYAGNSLQNAGTLEEHAAFLQKPFAPATLSARVREVLDANKAIIARGTP